MHGPAMTKEKGMNKGNEMQAAIQDIGHRA